MSPGNAQRLGLASILIHAPDLVVLDESANGLAPAGVVEIRAMLAQLATGHGTTVFLSGHPLAEVSLIVTRIGVIHEGHMGTEFTGSDLPARVRRRLVMSAPDNTSSRGTLASRTLDTWARRCGAAPRGAGSSVGVRHRTPWTTILVGVERCRLAPGHCDHTGRFLALV